MGEEASTAKTVSNVLAIAGLINMVGYLAACIIGFRVISFGWVLLISALVIPTATLKDSEWYGIVSASIRSGRYSDLPRTAIALFVVVTLKTSAMYGAGRILHWIFA